MRQRHFRRDRQRLDRKRLGRRQARGAVVTRVRSGDLDACQRNADDRADVARIDPEGALEKLPRL